MTITPRLCACCGHSEREHVASRCRCYIGVEVVDGVHRRTACRCAGFVAPSVVEDAQHSDAPTENMVVEDAPHPALIAAWIGGQR